MSDTALSGLLDDLAVALGPDAVRTDSDVLSSREADWRGQYRGRASALILPRTVEQVSAALRLCSAARTPVVLQGGRTGLSGAAQPDSSGKSVLLSVERLNRLRGLDADSMTLAVEAGMTLQVARQHAATAGLALPILLGSEGSAQVGGIVATNAGGSNVLRFGMARSRLLGLEVVLADGRVWNGLRSLVKDNAGYSLAQMFAGSEGTLGVITAAAFQLTPQPRQTVTVLAGTQDIGAALRAFKRLRSGSSETMVAAEYMSRAAIEVSCSHRFSPVAAPLAGQGGVLFEWATASDTTDFESAILDALVAAVDQGDLLDPIVAKNEAERMAIWSLRDTIGPGQGDAGYSVKNDVSVPVSQLVELVERGKRAVEQVAPMARPIVYGHLGDGNLHFNFSPVAKADDHCLREREAIIVETLADVVDVLGGSFSAEHGIGQSKRQMLAQRRSGVEIDMMRRIKSALDPAGILNPGKVL